MAEAVEWVSRILAVTVEICAPGIGGAWLDRRWGTHFLALVGLLLGLTLGMAHLLLMVRIKRPAASSRNKQSPGGSPSESSAPHRPDHRP